MKRNIFIKILLSSGAMGVVFFVLLAICVLMLFNFFFDMPITLEAEATNFPTVRENAQYAERYRQVLTKKLNNGYIPLIRILYFYLEDNTLSFDEIYDLNIDKKTKRMKDIHEVCMDSRVSSMNACSESSISDNASNLALIDTRFNFPLKAKGYTVTSFFPEQRNVMGKSDVHNGFDFAIGAKTPVYSVCNGTVEKVVRGQNNNIPYTKSGNGIGNSVTIKCTGDYVQDFYVIYMHLYPNSIKVNKGDVVNHWTQVASVGTTGYSTGNHLHYQVKDSDRNDIDGMLLVDMNR